MVRSNRRYKDRVYKYLFCGLRSRTRGRERCHGNHLSERAVTAEISAFLDWLGTEENLQAALAAWGAGPDEEALAAALGRAQETAGSLRRQRERLGLALAAGKMDFDLYRSLDDGLLRRLEAEEARAADLERQLAALPDLDERREVLESLAGAFPEIVRREDPEALAALLQNAGLTVWCEDGEVVEVRLG